VVKVFRVPLAVTEGKDWIQREGKGLSVYESKCVANLLGNSPSPKTPPKFPAHCGTDKGLIITWIDADQCEARLRRHINHGLFASVAR
jgi:hypothetical protein